MGIKLTGFDELLEKLDKLSDKGRVDEIAKKAVDAARGTVESSVRGAIASSEYGLRSTGSIAASVRSIPARVNQYGVFSTATPTGRHPSGIRNAELAAYLNYGTAHMAARPWRSRAVSSAESPATKIMEEIIKSEMGCD